MNKTAIKNYAIWARTKLIENIKYKASLLGITEKGIADALPQSTPQEQYFAIGTRTPYAISGVQVKQRRNLAAAISQRAQNSDYSTAYNSIMEEVAYTWFNRFIAVRFMEVNDYLPCKVRVLSAEDGRQEPDIVQNPFDAKLDYTPAEEEAISQYQLNNESDKLFNLLFIKVCNDLSKVLPQLFEAEQDYTELLLHISYTDKDGLVYKLVHDIPEEDFNVEQGGQVEIIGWLYQYYNTEPKNETFALLKKNVKITKERIPSATQLFTPDWIVRYMVENSLGRLWLEGHAENIALKDNWKYYLDEAQQEEAVQAELAKIREEYAKLRPEDIKVIDPCMGSGHILVYAFDILMQIYMQQGYAEKDAAIAILENNLYGLDIDQRAFQLAYFAVLMKARQYHKFILKKQVECHLYPIVESNNIGGAYEFDMGDFLLSKEHQETLNYLLKAFFDAKEYGSILRLEDRDYEGLMEAWNNTASQTVPDFNMTLWSAAVEHEIPKLIEQAIVLTQKYDVVITNPPYMGASGMSAKLSEYVKKNYPDSKSDLFAVFMEKADELVEKNRFTSLITMESWMFLSSFEKLRQKINVNKTIVNMVHMPYLGKGGTSLGINFGTAAVIMKKEHTRNYNAQYEYTVYYECDENGVPFIFPTKNSRWSIAKQENFAKIPGAPVAYWVSESVFNDFSYPSLSKIAAPKRGLCTCANDLFYRMWFEIKYTDLILPFCTNDKNGWIPLNKGGEFRKWYGNLYEVVDWKCDAKRLREYPASQIKNEEYYFLPAITWSSVTSGKMSFRYTDKGFIFDQASNGLFPSKISYYYLIGLLNSNVTIEVLKIINPSLNLLVGDIAKIPIINTKYEDKVLEIVSRNIEISKEDWDFFETSWDFKRHSLL